MKNTDEKEKDRFEKIVFDTLHQLVKKGIDKKLIEAAININEFKLREADYGRYPKGLVYCMKSMESWLHDEDPLMHLAYDPILEKIRAALTSNYFEKLIEEYLLNNQHRSLLIVKPKKGLAQEKEEETKAKLMAYKGTLTEDELRNLVKNTEELKKYQEEPNNPEELEKIPLISLEDINPKAEILPLEEKEEDKIPVLFHPMFTNEIAYINLFFDTTTVPQDLIPYVSLLSFVLGKVSTEKYSYEDLSNEINIYTGGIDIKVEAYSHKSRWHLFPQADNKVKCLSKANTQTF